jgi:hypothetical protein
VIIERVCGQQWCSLHLACGLNGQPDARGKTESQFQKMTALHRDPP